MSMFAASLGTLKKRTTQLLDGLDKSKDQRPVEAEDVGSAADILSFGPQASDALGCPEDSVLVQYEIQNGDDGERELSVFILPLGGAMSITLALVRTQFPPQGNFHFRFKAPTSDGSFGGWVWVDLASDSDFVPVYNGGVGVKALRLPEELDGAPARLPVQARQASAQGYANSASASHVSPAPVSGDLMELGSLDMQASPSAVPGAATPKAAPLDRAKLVAEREARMKKEYDEKMARHEELKRKEEQGKKEKVELNEKLSKQLNDWARTPDGQSFKEIRALLGSMHDVLWADSGWNPVSLADLVADSSVKKNYRKAILMSHPDRHQAASTEQQVRADRIFNALNESFKNLK